MWFKKNKEKQKRKIRWIDLFFSWYEINVMFHHLKTALAQQQQVTTKRWQKKSLKNYNFFHFHSLQRIVNIIFIFSHNFHLLFLLFFFFQLPTRRKSLPKEEKRQRETDEGKRRRGLHKFEIIFISYIIFFFFFHGGYSRTVKCHFYISLSGL